MFFVVSHPSVYTSCESNKRGALARMCLPTVFVFLKCKRVLTDLATVVPLPVLCTIMCFMAMWGDTQAS